MPTMGIVGSRVESSEMIAQTTEQVTKALDKGWRIATGGAIGTDSTAIKAAMNSGKGSSLDIYLPKGIDDQPASVRQMIKDAKAAGANVVENAGGSSNYVTACHGRNQKIVDNSDAVVAIQNNNSRGTQSTINKANAANKYIKVVSYSKGAKVSEKIIKAVKAGTTVMKVFAPIGMMLDALDWNDEYKVLQDYEDFKNGTATDEQKDNLIKYDIIEKNDSGYNDKMLPQSSADDGKYYSSSGKVGNPYHDSQGQFCSAGEAVIITW